MSESVVLQTYGIAM